ncbi:MAG: YhbY family RNA-binding protein [Betaproteobacteria bacterium]
MSALTSTERRAMRARAHHLDPVVHVGQHGLTPAVQHEIDLALTAHELVKVRVQNESRVERQVMLAAICAELDCAPVQHLGKLLILWRANPDKQKAQSRRAAAEGKGPASKSRDARPTESKPSPREVAADRRRRRNAQGGKAGDTTLPYFSRRGAGRFVASTPEEPAARTAGGASPRTPRTAGAAPSPRKPRKPGSPVSRTKASPSTRRRARG